MPRQTTSKGGNVTLEWGGLPCLFLRLFLQISPHSHIWPYLPQGPQVRRELGAGVCEQPNPLTPHARHPVPMTLSDVSSLPHTRPIPVAARDFCNLLEKDILFEAN
jgi:hypothetical protein